MNSAKEITKQIDGLLNTLYSRHTKLLYWEMWHMENIGYRVQQKERLTEEDVMKLTQIEARLKKEK